MKACVFTGWLCSAVWAGTVAGADAELTIDLWPEGVPGLRADAAPDHTKLELPDGLIVSRVHHPSLTVFPAAAEKANGTAIIICPGGGYEVLVVDKEGATIAAWFNARGVTAFVLRSRLREYGHPAPLRDVLRAIRHVRSQATSLGVQPDRIGVIGFSAGGHLASSAATLFDHGDGRTGVPFDAVSARPDFAILLYPVITMVGPFAQAGTRKNLIGADPTPEFRERLSTEKHVSAETPPTFLMHTLADEVVPVENSLVFYEALRKTGVPVEMHLYEKGLHGVGMLTDTEAGRAWPVACEAWLRGHGWLD